MATNKKQCLNQWDLLKLQYIAKWLQVRVSDVFRFAVTSTLAKLSPLHEHVGRGVDLLPVYLGFGRDITGYFNLDAGVLEEIINEGVDPQSLYHIAGRFRCGAGATGDHGSSPGLFVRQVFARRRQETSGLTAGFTSPDGLSGVLANLKKG